MLYQRFEAIAPRPLKRVLPRFYLYDLPRELLIIEYVASSEPLSRFLDARSHASQRAVAAALARIIAACQALHAALAPPTDRPDLRYVPWALRFPFPGPDLLRTVSQGQIEVIRAIQQDTAAWETLQALVPRYQGDCLVHGDLRWDNVLVDTGPRQPRRLRLIDWELAGIGDAAWDPGSALAAFLVRCLCWMEPGDRIHAAALRDAFTVRLPSAKAEIKAFWTELSRYARWDRDNAESVLARAVPYCGARLLQYAYEWSPGEAISPIAACFLQLGLNILRRPVSAAHEVLGITARAA